MDLLLALAIFTVSLAGVVRGFSGFGAGLIMAPLLAIILTPPEAVYYATILSLLGSLFMCQSCFNVADWRATGWLFLGSLPTIALGNAALLYIPANAMRIIFAILIILIAAITLSGWVYQGVLRRRTTLLAGAISGLTYGSVGSGGPPAMMYLSGTTTDKASVRATVLMHANLCLLVTLASLSQFGNFFVKPDWHLGLMIAGHFAGVYGGTRLFHLMGDRHYDRIVLWFLIGMGLVSLVIALQPYAQRFF